MTVTTTQPPQHRRRLLGGAVGNFIENFDFLVYGLSAPMLALHFFPQNNQTAAILSTFAVYAVGFVMRPLGGIFFGYLGDKVGRIRTLAITVMLIGGATAMTGLLPTYESIGFFATILLVVLRLVQGFSVGGETSGSYTYVLESAPEGKRAMYVGATAGMGFLPAAMAGFVILGLQVGLGDAAYESWGWRIPFLIGGALALAGLWIRLRLDDPEEFTAVAVEKNPLGTAIRTRRRLMTIAFLLQAVLGVSAYLLLSFMYSHLVKSVGLDSTVALLSNAVSIVLLALLLPVFGLLSDRVGRKPVLIGGSLWLLATAWPALTIASNGSILGAFVGQFMIAIGVSSYGGAMYATTPELFPTSMRWSANALPYNIGAALFGGTAALISTALVESFGNSSAPAYYVMVLAVICLVVVVKFTPETHRVGLRDSVDGRSDEPSDSSDLSTTGVSPQEAR